jgi:hypothetical protein
MRTIKPEKSIAQIFEEFLADQKPRISHKTFLKYESIIDLYRSYLESYWPGHDGESDKVGGKYCDSLVLKTPLPVSASSSATSCPGRSCAARRRCRQQAPSQRNWRSGWQRRATSRTPNTHRNEREKPPRTSQFQGRGQSA